MVQIHVYCLEDMNYHSSEVTGAMNLSASGLSVVILLIAPLPPPPRGGRKK